MGKETEGAQPVADSDQEDTVLDQGSVIVEAFEAEPSSLAPP
jgi:hypothetical protein